MYLGEHYSNLQGYAVWLQGTSWLMTSREVTWSVKSSILTSVQWEGAKGMQGPASPPSCSLDPPPGPYAGILGLSIHLGETLPAADLWRRAGQETASGSA